RALGDIAWDELALRETARFTHEMNQIHVMDPDHFVFASDELFTMFTLIEKLLKRGNAYQNDGWVYFSVASDPTFGQLADAAGLHGYDNLLATANQNGNDPDDPRKRDPLDFLLWRGETPGEPSWPSPWGVGRPGWHIECSAMATKYLGPQVDIHGGGTDLIFPHHSCEIAQSENATDVHPFARHWMHVGMVALDGVKMSKSLGNLIIVNQLLANYTPDAVRALLASHQYREKWEYFESDMQRAQALTDQLKTAATGDASEDTAEVVSVTAQLANTFMQAIDNDLDTPGALAALDLLAQRITSEELPAEELPIARGTLRALAHLLGMELARV
ncbi:MAG TPA: class I tRNA ligase family protein, partial [Ktedonobacterales bacterium]|nr:class I tRNA ligase family protein [Ktedonobacterales bacterium]